MASGNSEVVGSSPTGVDVVLREDFSEPSQKSLPLGWSYKALTIGRCSHDVRRHVKNVVFSSVQDGLCFKISRRGWDSNPRVQSTMD